MTTNKSPDWGWWRHVPTVTLREAVALSLNIDPARSLELLSFHERREFEKRQALAKRCLGEGLDGPLNWAVVHYEGAEPVVSLKAFATWAINVDWQIPAALAQLASSTGRRVRDPEPPAALADHGLSPESGDFFMPTGAPGRPSRGMHVIRAEFDRRRVDDQCKPSLREEAGELESWFHLRYPRVQPVTLKTIENNIRVDYRTWKASRQN